jgi:hypothetical protein
MTMWSRPFRISATTIRRCPTEQQLAAYADRQLVGSERQVVESHIVSCNDCLHQVGFLIRSTDNEGLEPSAELLQKARQLARAPQRRTSPSWRWAIVTAALAVVVITSAVTFRPKPQPEPRSQAAATSVPPPATVASLPSIPSVRRNARPVVRGPKSEGAVLRLISPVKIVGNNVQFTWSAASKTSYYVLRVVTSDGDLVWEGQSRETKIRIPADLLKQGKYFAWVLSYRDDGQVAKSDAVEFRVGNGSH